MPNEAWTFTPAVLDFVLQQRAASPGLTTAELIARIQQQFDVTVHRRTIERHWARQEKKLQ